MSSPAEARASSAPTRALHRLPPFLGLALVVLVLDQVTKEAVRSALAVGETWPEGWTVVRVAHIQNTGAAFGILQGGGDFLVIAALVAIAAVTFFLLTLPSHGRLYPVALALILGGAVGNLVDRLRHGAVTDFIDVMHYPWAFNVADSCIVVGVATLGVLAFLDRGNDEADADPAEAPR